MRSFLYFIYLFILVSCESNNQLNFNESNKKQKKIQINVTTDPSIKVKK